MVGYSNADCLARSLSEGLGVLLESLISQDSSGSLLRNAVLKRKFLTVEIQNLQLNVNLFAKLLYKLCLLVADNRS